jgi:mono/diheme cytochrome c family protein
MKKVLKYVGIALGSLVALLLLAVGGLYAWTGSQLAKKVEVAEHPFVAPRDSASAVRGEHLVRSIVKCVDCHGQDLTGTQMIADAAFMTLNAPNLTPGNPAIAAMSDEQLERAIRHGMRTDGTRLLFMPSEEYQRMSDEDLGAVIAYLRSVPAVEKAWAGAKVGPVARGLYASGAMPLFPYDLVTHTTEVVPSVPLDTTAAYGKYLGDVGCAGCHGQGYGGGRIPGTPPDFPPPANLTPTGIGHYTYPDFVKAMREGIRPDGSAINPFMPIAATKLMTDVELLATWKYLQSLPSKEYGTR